MTLQQQYNLIKEGKGDKAHFLKNAKFQFPNLFNAFTSYEDSVNVLKGKGLIAESTNGAGGVVTGGREQDWVKIFKQSISEEVKPEEKLKQAVEYYNQNAGRIPVEKVAEKFGISPQSLETVIAAPSNPLFEAKAVENKTSKEVEDVLAHNFNYKDDKNIDNVYGQAFLHGFYTEIQDPKNEAKTVDEVKEIVRKNLASNRLHYTEDGMFGVKGVGYTTEAPGLGTPKEPKGKYKSSGYGDLREGMNNFHNPPGFQKPELSDIDKMYTTEYKGKDEEGNDVYVIYKNGKQVNIVNDKGDANAWINNEKRKLKTAEPENTFLEPGEKQTFEPISGDESQVGKVGDMLRASTARYSKLKEIIRELVLQELNSGEVVVPNLAKAAEVTKTGLDVRIDPNAAKNP